MTAPILSVIRELPALSTPGVIVVGAVPEGSSAVLVHSAGVSLAQLGLDGLDPESIGVTGASDELIRLPIQGRTTTLAIVGLGKNPSPDALRCAAGSAIRQLAGTDRVVVALPIVNSEEASAVLEGAGFGGYGFSEYRSATRSSQRRPVERVDVVVPNSVSDDETVTALVSEATAVTEAMARVKDLVNTPPNDLYPETFVDAALAAAADLPVEVKIWDEAALAAEGFGGILGVGAGSHRPPRLVKISYTPTDASTHLALVGKGITFDSGGLSLKPAASMVGMKYDMTGAATVMSATLAVARLGLPIRLTAWLCLAENMPSGKAARPNDVLRMRGGRTVEVLNTDAEGRLVLADGLVAASEENPDAIVDVATLTGAARVALGNRYIGVLGDDELVSAVVTAGESVGEKLWQMPMPAELRPLLNSDIADIANVKPGNSAGGMLIAAIFLREFIGRHPRTDTTIPWAHLDIAGPADNAGSAWGFTGKGPTGVAVRTLIRLSSQLASR